MVKLTDLQLNELNRRLENKYGWFLSTHPSWKVIWSNDAREYRRGIFRDFTPEGIFVREVEETRLLQKYFYIKDKYVLERALIDGETVKFEPMWTFEDANGNALEPKFVACVFIIDTVYDAMAHKRVPEKHPLSDPKTAPEVRKAEIDAMVKELYGNESHAADKLSIQEGIVVPSNYGVK